MLTKYAQQHTPGTQLNPVAVGPAKPEVVFSAWWHGDPAAGMAHLPGFEAEPASDYPLVAQMAQLDLGEVLARGGGGRRPYIGRLGGHPLLGVLQGARANWLLVSLALALSMIPIVAFLLAPRRKLRRLALEDAVVRGALTAELRAALADQIVLGSRAAEMMITGAILALMVLKPF